MRPTRSLLVAFLALLLSADLSLAQPPDGGGRRRGPRGSDGQGSRGSGGSDGQDSRGFGRGGRGPRGSDGQDSRGSGWGGGSSRSRDPGAFFDKLSGGKDVWKRSESDQGGQMFFDRIAGQMGIKGGEITRAQFVEYMNNRMKGAGGAPAVAAGTTDPNIEKYARNAEISFRALDKNGDGRLEYSEMPDDLKAELNKWDTNKNGTIELEEYKAYYVARREQRKADWAEARGSYAGGMSPGAMPAMPSRAVPGKAEPKKPLVYTKDNLPKELPSWFRTLADADAQISFSEWKAAGRSVDEFKRYDLNNDGFITVPEVLAYQDAQTKRARTGTPGLHVVQGGTTHTTAGSRGGSVATPTPPNPARFIRPNVPPGSGGPASTRLDLSGFRNGGPRNRGDQGGGTENR